MTEKNYKSSISVLDIIFVFVKYKFMIFMITFSAAIIILFISLYSLIIPNDSPLNILPNIYKPEVKILTSLPGDGGSSLASMAKSSDIGSLLGLMGEGSVTTDMGAFIQKLAELNEVRDKIINEFDMLDRYHITKFPLTSSRKIFMTKVSIIIEMDNPIVTIGFKDRDAEFATKVINSLTREILSKYTELTQENTKKRLEFYKRSMNVAEQNYKKTQNEFITFQKENGVMDVSEQAEQSIVNLAKLKADLAKKEIELKKLLEIFKESDPKVVRLKKEIDTTEEIINEAEMGMGIFSGQFIPQDMIPELTRKYLNLKLEMSIQAEIYKMLRKQYEATLIEELDTAAKFQILETAEIPEKKDQPSRSFLCLLTVVIAFLVSILVSFVRNYVDSAKEDPEENKKLIKIKEGLRIFRRKKNNELI